MRTFRLVISCPDRVGIVAKVSNFLASHNGWITEASHHSDNQVGWFFMRHEIRADSLPFGIEELREKFAPIAEEFSMDWRITDTEQKKTRSADGQPRIPLPGRPAAPLAQR